MKEACKECDKNQVHKVCSILNIDSETERQLLVEVDKYLEICDMSKTNPEVMGYIWRIIINKLGNNDPYYEIKLFFNKEVLKIIPDIKEMLNVSENRIETILKIVISGNLIDFAAKHKASLQLLKEMMQNVTECKLEIDDSRQMFTDIQQAKSLLFLGDNCGEIVLDKLFLEEIAKQNKKLKIYYGVRGVPIVNDVTYDDAKIVNMSDIATVVSNGDGSLGTELKYTSKEFNNIFYSVDLIIAKGQKL